MPAQISNQQLENMSIYIPHVFPNFTEEYIKDVFIDNNIGIVDHVDLVAKLDKQGKPYNAAYIHFKYWCFGLEAAEMYYRIRNPNEEARLVHDAPWFWILLENTAKKYEPAARRPRIELVDQEPREEPVVAPYIGDYMTEEERSEIEAAFQFFQDEATELELQNELSLEDENQFLHEQIAIMAIEIADLKAYLADLRELYQKSLEENGAIWL